MTTSMQQRIDNGRAYGIGGNAIGSFSSHAIRKSTKELLLSLRALRVGSSKMAKENSPEVILPRLGKVALETHGSLEP